MGLTNRLGTEREIGKQSQKLMKQPINSDGKASEIKQQA
jgi:hypothetical protein